MVAVVVLTFSEHAVQDLFLFDQNDARRSVCVHLAQVCGINKRQQLSGLINLRNNTVQTI